jgi:hypothetical protein
MFAGKSSFEIVTFFLGLIGTAKATVDLINILWLDKPTFRGEVTDRFYSTDYEEARREKYYHYLFVEVSIWNEHVIPSSIMGWIVELDCYGGDKKEILSDHCRTGFWESNIGQLDSVRNDAILTKYVHQCGWLRFRINLYGDDSNSNEIRQIALRATDGRGRSHRLAIFKPPKFEPNKSTS